MKIGILTYHFGTNFGGQLQCYALTRTLEAMGYDIEIINYIPGSPNPTFWNDLKNNLRFIKNDFCVNTIISGLLSIIYSRRMRKNFEKFKKKNLNIGQRCNLDNFNELYKLDAIFVGSDQVWAPAHHESGAYFFNFKKKFDGKKISYAPCCAINKVEGKHWNKISNLLNDFDVISVRNKETQKFVKELIGKDVPIVADPTFLHSFEEFRSSKTPKGNYILTYILGDEINGGHKQAINKIKREYGNIPIYSINLTASKPHYFSWSEKTYHTLDPIDWVDFIRNAKFLYTDSFHGVVFAIKLNIPFLAYYKEIMRASRFIDLKERYNLKNIINTFTEIENVSLKSLQPGDETKEAIDETKAFSIEFIKKALL